LAQRYARWLRRKPVAAELASARHVVPV
jgi:hypothetical protein